MEKFEESKIAFLCLHIGKSCYQRHYVLRFFHGPIVVKAIFQECLEGNPSNLV